MANAYRALGKDDEAMLGYRRFMELDPKNAQIRYEAAQILIDSGKLDAAAEELDRALTLEPKLAAARNALGVLAMKRGDLDAAQREIQAAIEQKPDVRLAHFNLGVLAEQRQDFQRAIAEYKEEIARHPSSYKAAFNLGLLYGRLGDRPGQLDAYKRAIEMNPSFAEGHLFLAKVYLDAGQDLAEALRLARKGVELAPRSEYAPLGHYVMADIYARQGKRDGIRRRSGTRTRAGAFVETPTVMTAPSVLLIGSEAHPFAKSGGLADVLGALPTALARLGWAATVALPRYRGIVAGAPIARCTVAVGGFTHDVVYYEAQMGERRSCAAHRLPGAVRSRNALRTEQHRVRRQPAAFCLLVRAALEFVARRGERPTIVHAHDWQAGLAPVYLKSYYATHPVLGGVPSLMTIHNLAYQGNFAPDWLPRLDLAWEQYAVDRLEFWGRISFLKGGIIDADFVTTVSPRYAEEIQTT